MSKCCICGIDIPDHYTVMMITLPGKAFEVCCLSHEGSQELKDHLGRKTNNGTNSKAGEIKIPSL